MLDRALETRADGLILDLEDSVTPDQKVAAREQVARWLREVDFGEKERIVRINALDSDLAEADLRATAAAPPDAYIIPKVESAAAVDYVASLVAARAPDATLIPIATETPAGLLGIEAIARAPRVSAITWGAEDLGAVLGVRATRNDRGEYLDVFRHARTMTLLAAAAAGVDALDGVYVDFQDTDGLLREAREAALSGFAGKMSIHPVQIDPILAAFTPGDDEIAELYELVAAFAEAQREGRHAFRFRGRMVDAPHLARARRVLARAGFEVEDDEDAW
jgi:citrate lyase subunit beta / citryl-CoA lyase